MLGIFHPFQFYTTPTSCTAVYEMHLIDFIFDGHITASLIDIATGSPVALTNVPRTWTLNGTEYKATRVTGSVGSSRYLFKVVLPGTGGTFYDGEIVKGQLACDVSIITANDCSNEWYDWETDPGQMQILIGNSGFDFPAFNEEKTIRISDGIPSDEVKLKARDQVVSIAPSGYYTILNAIKTNKTKIVNGKDVINLSVDKEVLNEDFSRIIIGFEYPKASNDSCCDLLNIDNIAIGGGGGGCVGFTVAIVNTGGNLSANITSLPAGPEPVNYRWYKNGSYFTSASSIGNAGIGTYKLTVLKAGCSADSEPVQIQSECAATNVSPYIVGNQLNANISNPPAGYTVKVKKDGVDLATSLPYVMTMSGTYFVHVYGVGCEKSGGIPFVLSENEDCEFSIGITKTGAVLYANTDAGAPSYKWFADLDGDGKVEVSTAGSFTVIEKGVYFLEITNGTCKQETYLYLKPTDKEIYCILNKSNGYEFTVYGVNFADFEPSEWEIYVNGTLQAYTAGVPTLTAQWSYNMANKLIISAAHAVTNALIIIKKA